MKSLIDAAKIILVGLVGLLTVVNAIIKFIALIFFVLFWTPYSTIIYNKVKKEIDIGYISFLFVAGPQFTVMQYNKPEALINILLEHIEEFPSEETDQTIETMKFLINLEENKLDKA